MPILVTLTGDGADAGRVAGSKCVANLACNSDLQQEVAQKDGIPPLVRMLKDSSDAGKESAATALGNLACNDDNKVLKHARCAVNAVAITHMTLQCTQPQCAHFAFCANAWSRIPHEICKYVSGSKADPI